DLRWSGQSGGRPRRRPPWPRASRGAPRRRQARSFEQIAELVVDAVGLPYVIEAEGDQNGVGGDTEHQPGQRDPEEAEVGVPRPYPCDQRPRPQDHRECCDYSPAEAPVTANEGPHENLADTGVDLE